MASGVVVIAEHHQGRLSPNALALMAFGHELAQTLGQTASAVALCASDQGVAEELAEKSGRSVLALVNPLLASYNAEAYLGALTPVLREVKPTFVVAEHSPTGWDFAPRLAFRLAGAYLTGISGFVPANPPRFLRGILRGKVMLELQPPADTTCVLTVLPAVSKARSPGQPGTVEKKQVSIHAGPTRTLGYQEPPKTHLDLKKAEVIIAVGRGLGDPSHLSLVQELADCFERASIGASRPVVDRGWLPLEHQVGMTGQTVAPRLYLALGISGALQHQVGMNQSELIVAVNLDRQAPIFRLAHLGVVQDLHTFLPHLLRKIKERA